MKKYLNGIYILFIFGLIIGISSCCSRKALQTTVNVTDTVTVTKWIEERDTVIVVPGDSVVVKLIKSASQDLRQQPIVKQSKQAKLTIKQVNDTVYIQCDCDTVAIKAKLKNQFMKEARKTETVKTLIQKERYVPWYVKVLAWIGGIGLVAIGGSVGFKLLK